jgi:hypothetical protein
MADKNEFLEIQRTAKGERSSKELLIHLFSWLRKE